MGLASLVMASCLTRDGVSPREWVVKSGMLIAMSVYTFLRLIVDHGAPNLLTLRQKEVDYCISMLREKVCGCGSGRGSSRPLSDLCLTSDPAVHGVPDGRPGSGPPAAECSPHP